MFEILCEEERGGTGEPAEGEDRPFGYYYDDGTGYEVYDPEKDEEDESAAVNREPGEAAEEREGR